MILIVYRIYTSILFTVHYCMLCLTCWLWYLWVAGWRESCAIGFSGIIFSMIVMETSLSGIQSRSVFGLFNVPAKWYAWILLIVFQLLMTNVSLVGPLCGIFSGFAYTYGFFNYLLPGSSFYSAIESSSLLSACVRRPGFILGNGGTSTAYLPTYSNNTSQWYCSWKYVENPLFMDATKGNTN